MTTTTQANDVKFFKTRDSATSLLRKLGIKARDYNFFIEKMADGRIACQVGRAVTHLETLKNLVPKTSAGATKTTKTTKTKTTDSATGSASKTEGVSAMARRLILAGHTNQEVWATIKEAFNLDDSKKHYPTWYRCEMKRKGMRVPN